MDVKIKKLKVEMDLGNNGVEFGVRDNEGKYLGDLRITKAKIEWCKGKVHTGNGVIVSWKELTEWFMSKKG